MPDGEVRHTERRGAPARNATASIDVPFSDDAAARAFVEANPDGASYEDVAKLLGLSREGVRQIERRACVRLAEAARAEGLDEHIAHVLASRVGKYERGTDLRIDTKAADGHPQRGAAERNQVARIGKGPQAPANLRLFSMVARARRLAKRAGRAT